MRRSRSISGYLTAPIFPPPAVMEPPTAERVTVSCGVTSFPKTRHSAALEDSPRNCVARLMTSSGYLRERGVVSWWW